MIKLHYKRFRLLVLSAMMLCAGLIVTGPVAADPIYSSGEMNPGHILIDFESFSGEITPIITAQGVTFRSAWAPEVEQIVRDWTGVYAPVPELFGGHALGHDYPPISIEFDTPVQEIGMGVFDPNWEGFVTLQIFDVDNNLLETIPVSAAPGSASFVGCVRSQRDIKRAVLMTCVENGGCEIVSIDMVRVYPHPLAGPAGPKGDPGADGVDGASGADGVDGLPGAPGAPGADGDNGEQGPQGDQGKIGPQGDTGPKGDIGDTGPQGVQGKIGPQGPAGPVDITREEFDALQNQVAELEQLLNDVIEKLPQLRNKK